MKIKTNKIWYLINLVWIGLIVFFGWKPLQRLLDNKREQEDKKYLSIEKNNEKVEGRITNRTLSVNWAGTYLFEVSSGDNFSLSDPTINNNYKKPYRNLIRFLNINDSICKPANTDSIYVYRKEGAYHFIFGKTIGER